MSKFQLFVSCKSKSYIPEFDYIKSIQTGASLTKKFNTDYHDDFGHNISEKNESYCELTAQYWVWQNINLDYYGFMHNRRYFSFGEKLDTDIYGNIHFNHIDSEALGKLGYYDSNRIRKMVEDNDIITLEPVDLSKIPFPNNIKEKSIYTHYSSAPQHDSNDLDVLVKIIETMYPDYLEDAQKYLSSHFGYFLNMFIMKRELFHEFCQWEFSILETFEKEYFIEANTSNYERRKIGFLAERLFGIYLTHLKRTQSDLRITYLQNCFFNSTDNPYPVPIGKETVSVVYVSSDEYTPLLSVSIQSLVSNISEKFDYEVIILSNGITQNNRSVLESIVLSYQSVRIRFIEIKLDLYHFSRLNTKFHITVSSYARFLIFKYLINYEKLVYLDSDTIINKDIAELYHIKLSDDYYFAGVRDSVVAGWYKQSNHEIKKNIDEVLQLIDPFSYFNSGVLVMNVKELLRNYTFDSILEIANSREWLWMDQDILNFISKGRVKLLSSNWNVMIHTGERNTYPENTAPFWILNEYNNAIKDPYILHFAGKTSPCYVNQQVLGSWIFWKYARLSPFYEHLQAELNQANLKGYQTFGPHEKYSFIHRLLRFVFRVFKKLVKVMIMLLVGRNEKLKMKITRIYNEMYTKYYDSIYNLLNRK